MAAQSSCQGHQGGGVPGHARGWAGLLAAHAGDRESLRRQLAARARYRAGQCCGVARGRPRPRRHRQSHQGRRSASGQRRRGMSTDLVRYSVSGGIAEIMLDRAPVNALSMPLIDALLAALAKARDDEAVRAVIVGSAHKVFCAGLDLDIVRGKPGIETKKFLERLYFALNDTQYRIGKPTIAAVDGAVRAGGMTIAISCDMIIAGDASTFGYPEIDVGLIPAIHFVQLPRLVGKHQAFGPLFLGEPFDAATAFRMGLLSEVVPKGTALDRARVIAQKLAAKSPIVMKIGRDAFMRAVDADFRRSVENAAESFALVATTEDCQEGLNAFVEKRTPNYRGR